MKLNSKIILLLILTIFLFLPYNGFSGKSKKKIEEEKEESQEVLLPKEEEPVETLKKPYKGKISGRVLDDSQNPVVGIAVLCIDKNGHTVSKTKTNANGNYKFIDLEEGDYSISVDYQGFINPLQIKLEEKRKRPRIPINLVAFEFGKDIFGNSFVRVKWEKMPDALSYKCEIYKKGDKQPLLGYTDILQNYCEFGDLEEDTDYRIRVYSKNKYDYSASYAVGLIHTINKPPLSPFGLGIKYAKNYRIDLIFNGVKDKDLAGYVIQVKKDDGNYLYYSKNGLTAKKEDAYIVEKTVENPITFTVDDGFKNKNPIIDNTIPYSFRVLSIDEKGLLSRPSSPVENIVLEDTIPPASPFNIKYNFMDENKIRVNWETDDRDVARYRLYYGSNKNRWTGVIDTKRCYCDLIVNKNLLDCNDIYIAVTAIDRAGNESGYKPFEKKTKVSKELEAKTDIVLSHDSIYKDLSVAIKKPEEVVKEKVPIKKRVAKKPLKPKTYSFNGLKQKGFVVESGETATIRGDVNIPENTIIIVKSKGTLLIEDSRLSVKKGLWGGVRFLSGSNGYIKNAVISKAVIGVALINNTNKIPLVSVKINECEKEGIYIKNSRSKITALTVEGCETGLYMENGDVEIKSSVIRKNKRGVLSKNYNLEVMDSNFTENSVYGLRVYGGGTINHCSFIQNMVGIVLEEGNGSSYLLNSKIEQNQMDGIVINTSSSELRGNLISRNGRNGIWVKEKAGVFKTGPLIKTNDIVSNRKLAVFGGGKVEECFIAYNNSSNYVDDTKKKGKPDGILSSSSSAMVKQILNVDYIDRLAYSSVLK